MGRRFQVNIDGEMWEALEELASAEIRDPKDQLLWCARQYLLDHGLLSKHPHDGLDTFLKVGSEDD